MSIENLKEYARRCATESELLARAKAFGLDNVEEHRKCASALGLDWTEEDMAAFRKEVSGIEGGTEEDLTEEELDQVAGGAATVTLAVLAGAILAVSAAGVGVAGVTAAAGSSNW